MRNTVKAIASSLLSSKKAVLGIALLVVLFSIVPLQFAEANIFSDIANYILTLPLRIVAALLALAVSLLALLFGFIFFLQAGILKTFVIGTLAPVVTGKGIHVVDIGWAFSRDLVNISLLLILVFIGLATILRIQSYQLQRTLPLLIIVALLVNFSAVFVGFVVDVANLVTNAIMSKVAGFSLDNLEDIWDIPKDFLVGSLKDLFAFGGGGGILDNFGKIVGMLVYGVSLLLFYIFASLILFVVLLLFVVRTIVLWTLVILAPLAFASFILPATKRFWNQWLQQLIQWSIIGIPISLFLWLGMEAFGAPVPNITPDFNDPNLSGGFAADIVGRLNGMFAAMMGPFVGLFLMMIGVMLSMQMAPAGANKVIGFGTKWGILGGLAMGSAAWRFRGGKLKMPSKVPGIGGKEIGFKMKQGAGTNLMQFGQRLRQKYEQKRPVSAIDTELAQRRAELQTLRSGEQVLTPERIQQSADLQDQIRDLEEERKTTAKQETLSGLAKAGGGIAKWAGKAIELSAGEAEMRMKAKDEREIGAGTSEGTNKDAKDNATKINQEFAKGAFANLNRIVGLLNAMVKNGDSNDLQEYLRTGVLDPQKIGQAIMAAQRGGPPAFRPLAKALYGRLLTDPESLGFEVEKERDGTPQRDRFGNPVFAGETLNPDKEKENLTAVGAMLREIPEKLTQADIASKILGDTIDVGKAGGVEFKRFGGEMVIRQLVTIRGGDLLGSLLRRPESVEGRAKLSNAVNELVRNNHGELDEPTLRSIYRYLTSTAAQGLGIGFEAAEEGGRRLNINQFLERYPPQRTTQQPQVAPFRTTELTNELQEKQRELAQLRQAQGRLPVLTPQQAAQAQELQDEINRLNQELDREREERAMLELVAQKRQAAAVPGAPVRTLDEIREDVRREYEQRHRSLVQQQLNQQEPMIRWNAQQNYGGDYQQARNARAAEVYERLRLRDLTPSVSKPSANEARRFEEIAQGRSPLPPATEERRERVLRGSLRKNIEFVQEIEQNIANLSQEIEEGTARGEDVSSKEAMRNRWQGQLASAKTRMDEVRRELNLS